jgi:hypothetical protein
MLVIMVLSSPSALPISVVAAFTGYLSATILEAGNARKAMYEAAQERKGVYISSSPKANEDGEK